MINAIANYAAALSGNNAPAAKVPAKNSSAPAALADKVEISDAGLNALTVAQNSDEPKLSAKAQKFLDGLREKYGDYDFTVSSSPDAAQVAGSSKDYAVIFTPEEIERMADDDDYAQKVMGQVGGAVDMIKNISERDLGEDVRFAQLAVSFDDEGNTKLFAQLEKISAEQRERLEDARQRAEENSDAEPVEILFKPADIEAATEEELLAKIFGIDWDGIAEEIFTI